MTQRLVLMGVAGCGKSSVGAALSARMGIPYRDGDDLHPPENVAKMSRGEPLSDDDRWPWLALVGQALARDAPLIIGCSALKRRYRDLITREAGAPVTFIHLSGSRAVIAARMKARQGHFMPPALLDSQFAALEPPTAAENAVTIDIDQSLDAIVAAILAALEGRA
jgi:gluconokinase